jgi:hypothetical protein
MIDKLKGAWKSSVVWFNAVFITVIGSWPVLADSIPQLSPYLDGDTYKKLMFAVLAVNIILRFRTKKPLEDK